MPDDTTTENTAEVTITPDEAATPPTSNTEETFLGKSAREIALTKRLAKELSVMAIVSGADAVVVAVGMGSGIHYVSWSGGGLAVRGLVELGIESVRHAGEKARFETEQVTVVK
jgi:hypothetical protein